MSNLNGKNYNNYHYNEKRAIPYQILGTTYNPYQPKISNQVTQEKFNQSLGKTLLREKSPTKNETPYDNSYNKKSGKRSTSTAPLIANSYNIISNNPYSRSPNYNIYVKGYSNNRDHVKDLLNLTGRDAIALNYRKRNKFEQNNYNNKKPVRNNMSSYEDAKNELDQKKRDNIYPYNQLFNNNYDDIYKLNNKYNNKNNVYYFQTNVEEKISNDILEEYYDDNCGSLIKNFAYKENANSRFRDYMEDKGKSIINFNSSPDNDLFCLFDGHGGAQVSKFLQDNFPKYMKEILPINNENMDIKLKNLFLNLDNKIKENKYSQVGSTACMVYITKENGKRILYCANVGDTRCILISESGSKRLSYDDRASDENEYNRIMNQGGIVFGGRVYGQLMLSRAFGDWELKTCGVICEPHITRINIEDKDKYVVIASDGVWDVLEDGDVFGLHKMAKNSFELCQNIIQNSMDRGSMDNISCFIICLN